MHADGSHERLRDGGGILGVFPDQAYELGEVSLRRGDRIVFFTDGVTEASNSDAEEFGDARLLQVLHQNRGASAAEIQNTILREASEFTHGGWHDDATLLVVAVS